MADTKITELPELATIADDADVLEIVDDVGGTLTSKKTTVSNLLQKTQGSYTVTCTPDTSGTVTLKATDNTLGYTKRGDLVTVYGRFAVDSVSSPLGQLRFNVPFIPASIAENADRYVGSVISSQLAFDTGYTQINIFLSGGVGVFTIYEIGDNVSHKEYGGTNTFTGNEVVQVGFSYRAA